MPRVARSVQASSSASTVSEEEEIHDQVDDRTSDRVDRQPLLPTPATVPGAFLHRRHLLRHRGWTLPPTPGTTGRMPAQIMCRSSRSPRGTRSVDGCARRVLDRRGSWWALRDSNPRPSPCKGDALPAELSARACGRRVTARAAYHVAEL